MPRGKFEDFAGRKIEMSVVLGMSRKHVVKRTTKTYWFCRCECGKEFERESSRLKAVENRYNSCGCMSYAGVIEFRNRKARERSERVAKKLAANDAAKHRVASVYGASPRGAANLIHGMTGTPEYNVYKGMMDRCYKERYKSYGRYGGRGIKVCDRWKNSHAAFFADMGRKPSANHQLDRINNDGDYEPSNCRWATPSEQARNRRSNTILTIGDESMTIVDWSERVGIGQRVISCRLYKGWSPRDAVFTPLNKAKSLRAKRQQAA